MSSGYFVVFAVILAHGTIYLVLGDGTVQDDDNGGSSISIGAEMQQVRLLLQALGQHLLFGIEKNDKLNKELQGLQKLHNSSFQKMMSQHDIIMKSLQAVDQHLQEHDNYIKNQTDINIRSLQAFDQRLQEHDLYIKNQTDINIRSLQAVDQRLQEHDNYIKNQTDINIRSLQAVDQRLQEHDLYIKNQTDINIRSLQAVDRRLQEHDIYIKNEISRNPANDCCSRPESPVRDCSDIRASGFNKSGVYQVYVKHHLSQFGVNAFCDMNTTDGKWLVFQRRKDGSENFYRTWSEYAAGFGDPSGEFWLGNEMLHLLTTKRKYRLRIDLEDFEGQRRYAEYSSFVINSAADNYTLTLGTYSGTAGDSLSYHNGMQFSTKDADHDTNSGNCAQHYSGAWWYNSCHHSNLNGIYRRGRNTSPNYDGVAWYHWHGHSYSLKTTEMKFAPVP